MSWYSDAAKLGKIKDEDFEEYNEEYKEKMENWFVERTNKHIDRVKKFCKKIFDYDSEKYEGIIERGEEHDDSKWKEPEREPYVYITWKYKCEEDGEDYKPPEDLDDMMNEATEHHVKVNKHHPESHCDREVDLINREDRDKPPKEIIDAAKMGDLDIAEMVSDWLSMAEERDTLAKDWADKNVNIRWKFTDDQKDLIYELIEEFDGK